MKKENKFDDISAMAANAAKAESLLKELANANRLLILCSLVNGEKTVTELVDLSGLSQSALSQHLARLRAGGLVLGQKRGKEVFYSLDSVEVRALLPVLYILFCK